MKEYLYDLTRMDIFLSFYLLSSETTIHLSSSLFPRITYILQVKFVRYALIKVLRVNNVPKIRR